MIHPKLLTPIQVPAVRLLSVYADFRDFCVKAPRAAHLGLGVFRFSGTRKEISSQLFEDLCRVQVYCLEA